MSEGGTYWALFGTGMNTAQIAAHVDMPESHVYNRMRRGKPVNALPPMSGAERVHYNKLIRHLGMDRDSAIAEATKHRGETEWDA